ncbi:MAG TPA: hypothetical protein VF384_00675 [Planctomycetota bacterium]
MTHHVLIGRAHGIGRSRLRAALFASHAVCDWDFPAIVDWPEAAEHGVKWGSLLPGDPDRRIAILSSLGCESRDGALSHPVRLEYKGRPTADEVRAAASWWVDLLLALADAAGGRVWTVRHAYRGLYAREVVRPRCVVNVDRRSLDAGIVRSLETDVGVAVTAAR